MPRTRHSIVTLRSSDPAYDRLATASATLLAMHPQLETESIDRSPETRRRWRGMRWCLWSYDEMPVAIRTREFATEHTAHRDALQLAARADQMRPVVVRDTGSRYGWWIVLDDRPVLVAAFPASPSRAQGQARYAIQVLARLNSHD